MTVLLTLVFGLVALSLRPLYGWMRGWDLQDWSP